MTIARAAAPLIAAACLFGGVTLLLTAATGGLSPSLIEADEAGHYVNALFLGDWIRAGFPSPLPFAKDFYAHFPRLTIGHWPPAWYMLEAPLFAAVRPSPLAATCLAAFLSGLPGVAMAWAFARLGHARTGVALGLAYTLLPLVVDGARYLLVDQPLALVVALAAMAWAGASERPSWPRMLGFGLLAAACPLIKGNGALVALIPPLDIALTGRWRLLRRPCLWGAAVAALVIVAPWYWLSFAIAADGFNYAPGVPYAMLALQQNGSAILANVGIAGVLLAAAGAIGARLGILPGERRVACLALAVIAATLLFQSIVPASLAPRYIAPLLPWLVILAGMGIVHLCRWHAAGKIAAAVLALAALLPGATMLATLPPKPDLRATRLAAAMSERGGVWLVDGRSGAEGALIAAAAYADDGRRRVWVARASQWLSTSDFMGRGYRLVAADPAAVRGILDRFGAAGAVSVALHDRMAFPHSHLLVGAVSNGDYAVARQRFATGDGQVLVARRRAPVTPNVALLAADLGSAKVATMTGALR